jgi:hypothetical protein
VEGGGWRVEGGGWRVEGETIIVVEKNIRTASASVNLKMIVRVRCVHNHSHIKQSGGAHDFVFGTVRALLRHDLPQASRRLKSNPAHFKAFANLEVIFHRRKSFVEVWFAKATQPVR